MHGHSLYAYKNRGAPPHPGETVTKFISLCAAALISGFTVSTPAAAQDWPQKNIRIVVAFGPGGGTDIIGRILAEWMQEKLGKPVLIENRPGATPPGRSEEHTSELQSLR